VRGYQPAWREAPLLDSERTAGKLRRNLVDHVKGGQGHAISRTDEDLALLYGHIFTAFELVGGCT
jgi:hypothetical protein